MSSDLFLLPLLPAFRVPAGTRPILDLLWQAREQAVEGTVRVFGLSIAFLVIWRLGMTIRLDWRFGILERLGDVHMKET